MSFIETPEIRAEADRLAEEIYQSLVSRKQLLRLTKKTSRKDFLNEADYIEHIVDILGLAPLNRYEMSHVHALVFYIGKKQRIKQETLHLMLKNEFQVSDIEHIQRQDYKLAVECLLKIMDGGGYL